MVTGHYGGIGGKSSESGVPQLLGPGECGVQPYDRTPMSKKSADYSSMLMIGQFTTTPIGPQDFPSGPVI